MMRFLLDNNLSQNKIYNYKVPLFETSLQINSNKITITEDNSTSPPKIYQFNKIIHSLKLTVRIRYNSRKSY